MVSTAWLLFLFGNINSSDDCLIDWLIVLIVDTRLKYGDYTHNLERLDIYVDTRQVPGNDDSHYNNNNRDNDDSRARLHRRGSEQLCGSITRLNDALFKPVLHLQCSQAIKGRYVYIEAHGVANRWTRLFSAVLCEVMVYEWLQPVRRHGSWYVGYGRSSIHASSLLPLTSPL